MKMTLLQRINLLAERRAPENDAGTINLYSKAASVLRKLATTDGAAEKAHTITGIVKDLPEQEQERIIAAVEGIA